MSGREKEEGRIRVGRCKVEGGDVWVKIELLEGYDERWEREE